MNKLGCGIFFSMCLLLCACSQSATLPAKCETPTHPGALYRAQSGCFSYYVFAQTWVPEFCALNRYRYPQACAQLSNKWAATNFGTHGLWPNYRNVRGRPSYPAFCRLSPGCASKQACGINPVRVDAKTWQQLQRLMPVGSRWLIQHEWRKHGTCSGLTQPAYFARLVAIANQSPTPEIIKNAVGKSLRYHQITQAYRGRHWVTVICARSRHTRQQYLLGIRTYWNAQGKRIENPARPYTNCNRRQPIYIRRQS